MRETIIFFLEKNFKKASLRLLVNKRYFMNSVLNFNWRVDISATSINMDRQFLRMILLRSKVEIERTSLARLLEKFSEKIYRYFYDST